MKYGYFDDQQREYVITNPATPYPWINYLGTGGFFSLVSNTGGGYSFYKDARLRRITRKRYNSVPADDGGKYFYISEGGVVWSPGWKPVKTKLDSYSCRHGLGYSTIKSSLNLLEAEILFFVPLGVDAEIMRVKLTNHSGEAKQFKLHSFAEWALWDALDDMTNFQRNFSTGEVEIEGSCLYHKTEYRERRNHYAFFWVNRPLDGFDTDRDAFLGTYNGFDMPQMVAEGRSSQSIAHGWSPIASHYLALDLQPGEVSELIYVLGYVENEQDRKFSSPGVINKEKAHQIMAAFKDTAAVDKAFDELKAFWNGMLSSFSIKSTDERLDRMVNTWNQYQNMVTYFFSRSTSYFESGIGRGMGFRDSNQDICGMVHLKPEWARQRIIDLASTQLPDGSAYHQYQPLTKKGNSDIGSNFNDDPLWLIFSVATYLKETGDWSLLEALAPFDNTGDGFSIFEHIKRSFFHVVNNLGPHGLPLIGRADWNDCLNLNCFSETPGESFQTTNNKIGRTAESVMIAGMFVLYGEEFARICEITGNHELALEARSHIAGMRQAVEKHGWDGEWFLRAYDYDGNKVGSKDNDEGQIFIESQGFCVMAGIGRENGMARKALQSVEERLATPFGIVLLNPAYTTYRLNLGEISTYPPGYKENAGIFCHNNPWIVIAETEMGHDDKAFDYFTRICPAYLEEISDLHKTEPYVYAQMIAGKDAFKPGEAKNSWLTGTAAWNFYALTQFILGIRTDYDGLHLKPHLPSSVAEITVTRNYRGNTYKIHIARNNNSSYQLKVNGLDWYGALPCTGSGETYEVYLTY